MKLIFFPIEVYERELSARLKLVQGILEKEKCLIFLLDQDFLFFLAKFRLMPLGSILFKSLQSYMTRWFKYAYLKKSAIFLQDEESLVSFNGMTYPKTKEKIYFSRNDKNLIDTCKAVFCWSREEHRFYRNIGINCNICLTGNYRTSKLNSDYIIKNYKSEINSINKDYDKVILFCSTFVQGLHPSGENAIKALDQEAKAENYPEAIKWAYNEWRIHSHFTFFDFLQFVSLFVKSELKDEYKLVFRPHPSESSDFYKHLFQNLDGIAVDDRFSIEPWLEKAQLVIGSNCTTLVEAAVYGKPGISFLPFFGKEFDKVIASGAPAKFSLHARTSKDLLYYIRELRSKTNRYSKKIEKLQNSARKFVGLPTDWRFIQTTEILNACPTTSFLKTILFICTILFMSVIYQFLGFFGFKKIKNNNSYKTISKYHILKKWKHSLSTEHKISIFSYKTFIVVRR